MDVPVWITRPAVSWLMEVTAVVLYHMQFAVKTTNTAVPRDIGNITQRFTTPSPPPTLFFVHHNYSRTCIKRSPCIKRSVLQVSKFLCFNYRNFYLYYAVTPVNPLRPNISKHILHTVLYTFPKVLIRRLCLLI